MFSSRFSIIFSSVPVSFGADQELVEPNRSRMPGNTDGSFVPLRGAIARRISRGGAETLVKSEPVELIARKYTKVPPKVSAYRATGVHVGIGLCANSNGTWSDPGVPAVTHIRDRVPNAMYRP